MGVLILKYPSLFVMAGRFLKRALLERKSMPFYGDEPKFIDNCYTTISYSKLTYLELTQA